ncbi:DUF1837 domain-containing protein [Rhodoglobus sp. NPDC076762]
MTVSEIDDLANLLGVDVGYEDGSWRYEALTFDLIAWAADWILTPQELKGFGAANAVVLLQKALSRIYSSTKYHARGEIGELLLHVILRRFMGSEKVISRLYFKDAANDTVKGFDAVHIVECSDEQTSTDYLELWLGESKFYKSSGSAVRAVLAELKTHLETNYLRQEFAAISDKIPAGWKHEDALRALFARTKSLDEVFERVVVPVFITFDSPVSARHTNSSAQYMSEIEAELRSEWDQFKVSLAGIALPQEVRVQLILLPMASKDDLITAFDGRLKAWQKTLKP